MLILSFPKFMSRTECHTENDSITHFLAFTLNLVQKVYVLGSITTRRFEI